MKEVWVAVGAMFAEVFVGFSYLRSTKNDQVEELEEKK